MVQAAKGRINLKLFGNSKNGKHTASGGHAHPDHAPREEEYLDLPEMPEPPVKEPDAPAFRAPAEDSKTKQEQEDGLFNSIAEAVGMMDQLPAEPEQPKAKPAETPAPRHPEPPAPTPKRPEPPAPPRGPQLDDDMTGPTGLMDEPQKGGKGRKAVIIVGCILGVLLLIAIAAFAVVKLWITPPDPNDNDSQGLVTPVPTANVGNQGNEEDPPIDGKQTGRKDGNYTFTIVGQDVASGNTDVILVGKLDTVEGTLNVCSIPRDTLINYGINRINSAYAIGENNKSKGNDGVKNLKKELKKLMGFEIDNYAVVNTKAVAELIDAVGGVKFNVPINMDYDDPYQDLHIHIAKGEQVLSGDDAVKVLRFRHDYPGGDIQRIGVQQDFFKAVAKQFLDLKNIPNLPAAIKVYTDNVTTDLGAENVAWYLNEFLKLDFSNINFMTLPGNTQGSIKGASYVFIYVDEWLDMVNESLNPYYEQVTQNHVSIKTSSDGSSLWTTAGAANY